MLMTRGRSTAWQRKDKVVHVRLSPTEFEALEQAAKAAGMTFSAFVRSLSLEGAGVAPFLTERDFAILDLLVEAMGSISDNLLRVARAINNGRTPAGEDVAGSIKDAHVVARAVASELAEMTRRSSAARRGLVA